MRVSIGTAYLPLPWLVWILPLIRYAVAADLGFGIEEGIDCSTNTSCSEIHTDSWDRLTCVTKISTTRRKDRDSFTLRYENEDYFQRLPDGTLASTPDNMVVTMRGCEEFCGPGTFYWDAGPRITTWVVPVVLLLSNIEMSPIDKRRFITMVHAVGDPIDSFWSILHKMYVWRRLYAIGLSQCHGEERGAYTWISYMLVFLNKLMHWCEGWKIWARMWRQRLKRWRRWRAKNLRLRRNKTADATQAEEERGEQTEREQIEHAIEHLDEKEHDRDNVTDRARVIATVLAGFEEISGSQIKSEIYYKMVMRQLGNIGLLSEQSQAAWQEWRHCARVLADARTNEVSRTLLAIFIYVFGVVSALYEEVGGGNTSKPGGRIGSAVFLMWLVPLSLLSNTVGAFTSRRTCLTIMRLFVERCRAAIQKEAEDAREAREQGRQSDTNASDTGDLSEQGGSTSPAAVPQDPPSGSSGSMARVPTLSIGSPALESQSPEFLSPPTRSRVNGHGRARSDDYYIPARRASRSASPRASTPATFLQITPSALPRDSLAPAPARSRARSLHTSRPDPKTILPTDIALRSVTFHGDGAAAAAAAAATAPRLPQITVPPPLTAPYDDNPLDDSGSSPDLVRQPRHRPSSDVDPMDIGSARASGSTDVPRSNRTLEPLLGPTTPHFRMPNYTELSVPPGSEDGRVPLVANTSWHMYFTWLQPLGGIYTYRPWKIGYSSVSQTTHAHFASNWLLFLLAVIPIMISAVGAFTIIFYAVPVGFSCRHVWVVGVTVLWLASVLATTLLHAKKPFGLSGRTLWVLVTLKDSVVGLVGLALVFLSTTGLFNNCYCWSAAMWHRPRGTRPFVPLITSDAYDANAEVIYGPVVFACLVAQLAFFAFVIYFWWDGIYVVRWDEERCCREWRHEVSEDGGRDISLKDDELYLLFWYWKHELADEENERAREEERARKEDERRRSSRLSRFSIGQTPAQTPQGPTVRRFTRTESPLYRRIPQSQS